MQRPSRHAWAKIWSGGSMVCPSASIVYRTSKMSSTIKVNGNDQRHKVIFVLGATGTGKSRLSLDLATRIPAEIINSDKIQVYSGLDIATNKVTETQRRAVRHHLLGHVADLDADYTADDFVYDAFMALSSILSVSRVPIIVGGSNSYVEGLVEGGRIQGFRTQFECLFLWMDVAPAVLQAQVKKRVEKMVRSGLVQELRKIFVPGADYSRGIRRSIGAPELDRFLRAIPGGYFMGEDQLDEEQKQKLLKEAITDIKANTCKLTVKQVGKIQRFRDELGWDIHRIDATPVFEKLETAEATDMWEKVVMQPCLRIVEGFLHWNETRVDHYHDFVFPISDLSC